MACRLALMLCEGKRDRERASKQTRKETSKLTSKQERVAQMPHAEKGHDREITQTV